MRSNYKAIGELVERVDIRNTDGSIDTLIGLFYPFGCQYHRNRFNKIQKDTEKPVCSQLDAGQPG